MLSVLLSNARWCLRAFVIFALMAAMAAHAPSAQAQTPMDADNVKGWCTYLYAGGEACYGDPISACKRQYDDQAFGTRGFRGAILWDNGNTNASCDWTDLARPIHTDAGLSPILAG